MNAARRNKNKPRNRTSRFDRSTDLSSRIASQEQVQLPTLSSPKTLSYFSHSFLLLLFAHLAAPADLLAPRLISQEPVVQLDWLNRARTSIDEQGTEPFCFFINHIMIYAFLSWRFKFSCSGRDSQVEASPKRISDRCWLLVTIRSDL